MTSINTIPLWKQLQTTSRVVHEVIEGVSGTVALDRVQAELRPGVQALSFHVWRNLGRAMALTKLLASRKPPTKVYALMCCALALGWRDQDAPYDVFTLVDQAVEAAKRNPQTKAQANFVNACLRRFLREREDLIAKTNSDASAVWNHPEWWIERLKSERGASWELILTAANSQAPMTLRVNRRKVSVPGYIRLLEEVGLVGQISKSDAIILNTAIPVNRLPGFSEGLVSVQDTAAQLAAPLLLSGLQGLEALSILDACAAPGGKTGHLLEMGPTNVTALEIDPRRADRIHDNLNRLGLSAKVIHADAVDTSKWWDGQQFDCILLDAPCTASGIVRRHPDVRWLRRESDIAQLAELQRKMLASLWPLVKPGGRLLYCTCSIFMAEGADQTQTFLAHNTDARLLPSPGHLLPQNATYLPALSDNQLSDHDGFYYALFEKMD